MSEATDTFRKLQVWFSEQVYDLRKKKLLTSAEQSQVRRDFEEKLSRQEVTTMAEAKREADALRERLNSRRAPHTLPAKGRTAMSATFKDEQTARGFVSNWRGKDTGAYGMHQDGKRAHWKSHPDDHRRAAVVRAAEACGGQVKGE